MPHTLLLADDSVTIQRVIELTFAEEDVRVIAVSDGDQAIDCLEAAPPDIVLADVGMPGRDGYQVAQYIRDSPRLAHIPVLLLTGAFEPVDQARAAEAGCDGVLAKPFEPQLVIGRVKDLLSKKRGADLQPAPAAEASTPAAPPTAAPPTDAPPTDAPPTVIGAPISAVRPPGEPAPTVAPQASSGERKALQPAPKALDEYFDQLDKAFADLASSPAPATPAPSAPGSASPAPAVPASPAAASAPVPTVPPTQVTPPSPGPVSTVPPTPAPPAATGPSLLADTVIDWFGATASGAPREPKHQNQADPPAEPALPSNGSSAPAPVAAAPSADAAPVSAPEAPTPPKPEPPAIAESFATTVDAQHAPHAATPVAVPQPEPVPESGKTFAGAALAGPVVHKEPVFHSPPPSLPSLGDAFAALLAAEQHDAPSATLTWPSAPALAPAVTDELIEDICRRVLGRLSDRVVRETVADLASATAERLVREEIERIKAAAIK